MYQLERDKIHHLWEIFRTEKEEVEAELRNKEREFQEQNERQAVEARQYQQRIKHLLFEQQHEEARLRLDEELHATLQHAEHRTRETDVDQDARALKVQLKEVERSHADMLKNMRLEHDRQVAKLRADFERQSKELLARYDKRMRETRDSLDAKRKQGVQELEQRKDQHIQTIIKQHQRALHDINNYYKDIINSNMEKIKSLMMDVSLCRQKENATDKHMYELVRENKHLNEPLTAATKEAEVLRMKVEEYEKVCE